MATLHHWYKLDETSGTIAYDNGTLGNNLSIINTPAFVTGIIGNAFQFDGVDDRLGPITTSYFNGSKFSISLWFRKIGSAKACLIANRWVGATQYNIQWFASGVFLVYFRHTSFDDSITYYSGFNWGSLGSNWHHIVFTHDGQVGNGTSKIYADGVLVVTNNHTSVPIYNNASHNFQINGEYGGYLFNGSLDQIKIYNSDVLTLSEVQQLYYEGQPSLCWNYKARYKNSDRFYTANGSGKFPRELKVPSSVDISTGCMMDEGKLINSDQFRII